MLGVLLCLCSPLSVLGSLLCVLLNEGRFWHAEEFGDGVVETLPFRVAGYVRCWLWIHKGYWLLRCLNSNSYRVGCDAAYAKRYWYGVTNGHAGWYDHINLI